MDSGSALAWHPVARVRARLMQQVLRFVARIYTVQYTELERVLPMRVGSATSQLDLPFLTPLPVAGFGRLQIGVPHWATSVITISSC